MFFPGRETLRDLHLTKLRGLHHRAFRCPPFRQHQNRGIRIITISFITIALYAMQQQSKTTAPYPLARAVLMPKVSMDISPYRFPLIYRVHSHFRPVPAKVH